MTTPPKTEVGAQAMGYPCSTCEFGGHPAYGTVKDDNWQKCRTCRKEKAYDRPSRYKLKGVEG